MSLKKKKNVVHGLSNPHIKTETIKTINLTTKDNMGIYIWGNIFLFKTYINTTWKLEISFQWIADLREKREYKF